MHITGVYYYPLQNIGLKDNIFKLHRHNMTQVGRHAVKSINQTFKLHLYKVYLTHPWWYTKIILSPKCHIVNDLIF